jgi:hypothetical protein
VEAGPVDEVTVSRRHVDEGLEENRAWASVDIGELSQVAPWRTFRRHRGQQHYSGTYWSSSCAIT